MVGYPSLGFGQPYGSPGTTDLHTGNELCLRVAFIKHGCTAYFTIRKTIWKVHIPLRFTQYVQYLHLQSTLRKLAGQLTYFAV